MEQLNKYKDIFRDMYQNLLNKIPKRSDAEATQERDTSSMESEVKEISKMQKSLKTMGITIIVLAMLAGSFVYFKDSVMPYVNQLLGTDTQQIITAVKKQVTAVIDPESKKEEIVAKPQEVKKVKATTPQKQDLASLENRLEMLKEKRKALMIRLEKSKG